MDINEFIAIGKRIACGLLLTTSLVHASLTRPASAESSKSFDSIVAEQMEGSGMVGLAAAIIVNKQVVWTHGFGFADKALGRLFTADTIMSVGSIAKPFLGVAMMRAVREGKLRLDEDINTYLPFRVVNPHHPAAIITLRHLATHTSGITDRWAIYKNTYHFGGDSPEPLGDPGIQTDMLADVSKQVGVILFANTSLSGPEERASGVVFDALWKQAAALLQTAQAAERD